jgi:uncharacterized protein YdcH (DUF465 family)
MADAQLSLNDGVKDSLLQTREDFRQLVSEHQALDAQIRQLSGVAYLTDQEQFEETSLKKRKLALKDQIEAIVREQTRMGASPPRA